MSDEVARSSVTSPRPGVLAGRAEAAARDGSFRRSNPVWFGVYPSLFATGLTIAWAVSNSGLWGWVVVYDVGVSLLVVSLVLDGYSFEQDGLRIYSLARLRVRRIEWQQIRNFDVRGYWRGAGVWLVDGRWVALRPGSWPYREKSESEVSRLEIARQMHQGTAI